MPLKFKQKLIVLIQLNWTSCDHVRNSNWMDLKYKIRIWQISAGSDTSLNNGRLCKSGKNYSLHFGLVELGLVVSTCCSGVSADALISCTIHCVGGSSVGGGSSSAVL